MTACKKKKKTITINASLQFLADKTKKNELNAYEFHFFF